MKLIITMMLFSRLLFIALSLISPGADGIERHELPAYFERLLAFRDSQDNSGAAILYGPQFGSPELQATFREVRVLGHVSNSDKVW